MEKEKNKISIRFYNDKEVRAVWNEERNEWFFAIVDIVAAITGSAAPRKYWSVLKLRLKRQGNELPTICSQLKLTAADGKKYNTYCIPQSRVNIFQCIRVSNLLMTLFLFFLHTKTFWATKR